MTSWIDKQLKLVCQSIVCRMCGDDMADKWWSSWNDGVKGVPNDVFDVSPLVVYDYLIRMRDGES